MDQKQLEKEIIQFRDDLKEYQEIVREIWKERNRYSGSEKIEELINTTSYEKKISITIQLE